MDENAVKSLLLKLLDSDAEVRAVLQRWLEREITSGVTRVQLGNLAERHARMCMPRAQSPVDRRA